MQAMEKLGRDCVVFYGSQTGTAEDFASRLSNEASSRFGLMSMTADLADYDLHNLDKLPANKVALFVMATYGEGEPTDNATDFWAFITQSSPFSTCTSSKPLQNLHCAVSGLGNSTYQNYNIVARRLDKILTSLGANRYGEVGAGNDATSSTEDDFLTWKESMWSIIVTRMNLRERPVQYTPTLAIEDNCDLSIGHPEVYLGEWNEKHRAGVNIGPHDAQNSYIASILESRNLSSSTVDRHCLHMEIDISGTDMSYSTGDHVAIWPTNPDAEVDRFETIFDLRDKRNAVFSVKGIDQTSKPPFRSPTTYDAVVRHYLEICAPVSRQLISTVAAFAPDESARQQMVLLATNVPVFKERITSRRVNIAQTLQSVHPGPWSQVPWTCLLEGLNKLQPRYYSISSSSLAQPNCISITTVVESAVTQNGFSFQGVTTNYLLALMREQNGSPAKPTYATDGPRSRYAGIKVPIHLRRSNFRLPAEVMTPVIMVGPGTGIAPFRAFIQERAELVKRDQSVGKMILFFGCRRSTEDWLYRDEMDVFKQILSKDLMIYNAFPRDGDQRDYVQHHLRKNAHLVNVLLNAGASLYVCGDAATMAKAVGEQLVSIIQDERGLCRTDALDVVADMRRSGSYQEDIW